MDATLGREEHADPMVFPPWYRPTAGVVAYLPETSYFDRWRDSAYEGPFARAAHVTTRWAARRADRYWATPNHRRDPRRREPLPAVPAEWEAVVDALFRWFREVEPGGFGAEVRLRAGERWIMDAHDGFPASLHLPPGAFAELQERLEMAGLPRDLYVPLIELRSAIEPTDSPSGAAVLGERTYTPLRWARRDAAIAARRLPTEDERRAAFEQATREYARTLRRRLAELREVGSPHHSDEALEETGVRVRVLRRLRAHTGRGAAGYALFLAEPEGPWRVLTAAPTVDLAGEVYLRGAAWHAISGERPLGPLNPAYWEFLAPTLRKLANGPSRSAAGVRTPSNPASRREHSRRATAAVVSGP